MNTNEFAQVQYDQVMAEQTDIREQIEMLMRKDEALEVQRLKWLARLSFPDGITEFPRLRLVEEL